MRARQPDQPIHGEPAGLYNVSAVHDPKERRLRRSWCIWLLWSTCIICRLIPCPAPPFFELRVPSSEAMKSEFCNWGYKKHLSISPGAT